MPTKPQEGEDQRCRHGRRCARSLFAGVEREAAGHPDDRWQQQRRDVPEREVQDQQLARLDGHARFSRDDVEPVGLESGEQTEDRRDAEAPIGWGASTLYACETLSSNGMDCARQVRIRWSLAGAVRHVPCGHFTPDRPPARSASRRPAADPGERRHRVGQTRLERRGAAAAMFEGGLEQPLFAELLVGGAARLGQAVGEQHQAIARRRTRRAPARSRRPAARRAPGRRRQAARRVPSARTSMGR